LWGALRRFNRKKGYITYRGTHPDHRDRSGRLREVPPNTSLKSVRLCRTAVRHCLTYVRNRRRLGTPWKWGLGRKKV